MATNPKAPYGDVPYADPGYQPDKQKRYPIDCEHVQAAWSYINQSSNQRPYTADQLAQIKARIVAAMHKCGHETSADSGSRALEEAHERRDHDGIVEYRAHKGRIGGYAAVFGKDSRVLGGFVEQVESRAFERGRGRDWPGVVSTFNHDPNMMLGSTASGSLWLHVDDQGLDYEVQPPEARRDIVQLVERRDIRHSSFEFRAMEEDWGINDQGYPQRRLIAVELFQVGPVAKLSAYPDTTAALRSLAHHFQVDYAEVEQRAANKTLREFFMRTDVEGQAPKKTLTFGPAARMAVLAKRKDALA